MFTETAHLYDRIYAALGKDYAAECDSLRELIAEHKQTKGNALLDVACGTGAHAQHLQRDFDITGFDLDAEMVALARQRCPTASFEIADMRDFQFDRQFDVVACLFSSIGYLTTENDMQRAIAQMARHLTPGGVLIVEPWLGPDVFQAGFVHAVLVDDPELKVARLSRSLREGDIGIMEFEYLIARPEGFKRFSERHVTGLFSQAALESAVRAAGLQLQRTTASLTPSRGLIIGKG